MHPNISQQPKLNMIIQGGCGRISPQQQVHPWYFGSAECPVQQQKIQHPIYNKQAWTIQKKMIILIYQSLYQSLSG